jgi:HAD superfamily hydrolase (TIGR01509 family)
MRFREIEAVFFDMDGTLVDSEPLTMRAVEKALLHRGISMGNLDAGSFHGVTWASIATRLLESLPDGSEPITAAELQENFHHLHQEEPPPLISGSHEALLTAYAQLPTGICTSSNRQSLQGLLNRVGLPELLDRSVCAEDCTRSKPDPQGYLLAASRLGVSPKQCLVFEDSVPGVQAARSAGMQVIAVVGCSFAPVEVAAAAHHSINDYTELPPAFFEEIRRSDGE